MRSTENDLTARARTRDAAIATIARRGYAGTTIRAVASAAGVSPALVLHHFGSKRGLRDACDAAVWEEFHDIIAASTTDLGVGELLRQISLRGESSSSAAYLTRALIDGGEFAHRVFNSMVADVQQYLATAVRSGIVRPARDEQRRSVLLTSYSLGTMLLGRYIVGEDADPLGVPDRLAELFTAEGLDLFTDGLFTDSRIRDAIAGQTQQADKPVDPKVEKGAS